MRIRGRCAHDWARTVPPERSRPISAAVSRDDRKPWNTPSVTTGVTAGRDALVVVAEGAEGAGRGGVGHHVERRRPVAQPAPVLGREEGGAGVGRLHAQHPVELDGVPDRLVDLERDLAPVEDEGRDVGRALVGRQQLRRLVGHPGGLADEVEPADELEALGGVVAAEGVGVRAVLDLGLADHRRLDAGAALGDVLGDGGALARDEQRGAPPGVERGLGDRHARRRPAWPRWPGRGGRACPRGRRRTGPPRPACATRPGRLDLGEAHRGLPQGHAGPGHVDGPAGGRLHLGGLEPARGGEAPAAVGDHPDADAARLGRADRLDLAVAHPQVLGAEVDDAGVGVGGAGVAGDGHRPFGRRQVLSHRVHPHRLAGRPSSRVASAPVTTAGEKCRRTTAALWSCRPSSGSAEEAVEPIGLVGREPAEAAGPQLLAHGEVAPGQRAPVDGRLQQGEAEALPGRREGDDVGRRVGVGHRRRGRAVHDPGPGGAEDVPERAGVVLLGRAGEPVGGAEPLGQSEGGRHPLAGDGPGRDGARPARPASKPRRRRVPARSPGGSSGSTAMGTTVALMPRSASWRRVRSVRVTWRQAGSSGGQPSSPANRSRCQGRS